MRSITTRATAVEGVRSFLLESEKVNPVPMYATSGDPVLSPVWRRRALDPDGEGVSPRFRGLVVDLTDRMVVR